MNHPYEINQNLKIGEVNDAIYREVDSANNNPEGVYSADGNSYYDSQTQPTMGGRYDYAKNHSNFIRFLLSKLNIAKLKNIISYNLLNKSSHKWLVKSFGSQSKELTVFKQNSETILPEDWQGSGFVRFSWLSSLINWRTLLLPLTFLLLVCVWFAFIHEPVPQAIEVNFSPEFKVSSGSY